MIIFQYIEPNVPLTAKLNGGKVPFCWDTVGTGWSDQPSPLVESMAKKALLYNLHFCSSGEASYPPHGNISTNYATPPKKFGPSPEANRT